MHNERAWPQQCWKSCANESNIVSLRFGDHGTKEMLGVVGWKVWPVSNFAQQHATTSNNMQQLCKRTQHVTSNNVGSCWPTMRPFARSLGSIPFPCNLSDGQKNVPGFFLGKNNSSENKAEVSVNLSRTQCLVACKLSGLQTCNSILQRDSTLPWVYSVRDHRWRQNVIIKNKKVAHKLQARL